MVTEIRPCCRDDVRAPVRPDPRCTDDVRADPVARFFFTAQLTAASHGIVLAVRIANEIFLDRYDAGLARGVLPGDGAGGEAATERRRQHHGPATWHEASRAGSSAPESRHAVPRRSPARSRAALALF